MRISFCLSFLVAFLIIPSLNLAQSDTEVGLKPSININKKLKRDWSLNLKVESRQSLINDITNFSYLHTNFSFITSKKIGINTLFAAGYLMRVETDAIKNRAMQQLIVIRRYNEFMLSHRFAADQTFEKDEYTEYRYRYRVAAEVPLEGQTLDPREFFIKLNSEYLNSLSKEEYDLEVRGAAFLGYTISPNSKFEFGIDYRMNSFISGDIRNRLWVAINLYQAF
ncbi:MAG: DUF2490 domain-containing protein [Bacteroidales bacterium]